MSEELDRINKFVKFVRERLTGDEKGEGQIFCDRLFQAFGHQGCKEAGAVLEDRQKNERGGTDFCDLVWRPRLLLEMKKRGEKLQKYHHRLFEYWGRIVPHRPRYAVLCNFDEFWIYDFDVVVFEPVDCIQIDDLPARFTALNFLFPNKRKPLFGINREGVTRQAAADLATVFNSLVERGTNDRSAQRFILQCVVAMFSQSFDLLPLGKFVELLESCTPETNRKVIGGFFRQMNSKMPAPEGSPYSGVEYFNGELFTTVPSISLNAGELALLTKAARENWTKIAPPIFGTLFQSSMGKDERHALGAHFTSEVDIQKVVLPTIVRPWRERIENATKFNELVAISKELQRYRVLDPACGSGNFLYVAYRELFNLEMTVLAKFHDKFPKKAKSAGTKPLIQMKQFFGIDIDPFAVELAKVTLMLAKRLATAEAKDKWFTERGNLPLAFEFEDSLPLENLNDNILQEDALFCDWPKVDAVVGNPPFMSKGDMQSELGRVALNKVRAAYPNVSGQADYCVYWFRKSHDHIGGNGRVGLVGTNTIRQNKSREGGLDYIVANGGTITEAVSTQVWPGDAKVHVSIVNWIKGEQSGKKRIFRRHCKGVQSPSRALLPWFFVAGGE